MCHPDRPCAWYLLRALQQRDVKRHQPRKVEVGEGESLHVEDALLLVPAGFDGVDKFRPPQHVFVLLQCDAVCGYNPPFNQPTPFLQRSSLIIFLNLAKRAFLRAKSPGASDKTSWVGWRLDVAEVVPTLLEA